MTSTRVQLALVLFFSLATGWTVGVLKLVEVLMTTRGGRFETAKEQRAETYLVSFGLSKAACNYAAGRLADSFGRRVPMLIGWVAALALSPLVLLARNWGMVVAADVLLGVNQACCWSACVFVALDLLGPRHRALAVGLVETAGYSAIALAGPAVAAMGHDDRGVAVALFPLALLALVCLVLAATAQRETREPSRCTVHSDSSSSPPRATRGELSFACGGGRRFACTSVGSGLAACCLAGLALNFTTAFAWGALTRWLAAHDGGRGDVAARALLAYSLPKGVGQLPAGILADRRACRGVGPKSFVVVGLLLLSVTLAVLAAVAAPDAPANGQSELILSPLAAGVQALVISLSAMLGLATALAYPTLLACAAALAHPDRRSSTVGAVRCVRDLGYAVGGLLLGSAVEAAGGAYWPAAGAGAVVTLVAGVLFAIAMPSSATLADGQPPLLRSATSSSTTSAACACELQPSPSSAARPHPPTN